MIDERDLIASGNPQPVEVVEDREPVLDQWETAQTFYHSTPGISCTMEQRWHKPPGKSQLRREYRAVASIGMPDNYPGNETKYSKIFESYDQADVQPVNAWAHINPMGAAHQAEISAAVARSHRTSNQAAPSDIRKLAFDMASDLLLAYHPWKVRHDAHMRLLADSADIRAQIGAIAEDIAEFGMQPEYQTFARNIQSILSSVGDSPMAIPGTTE